ncbi:hypothetical protein Tco_0382745, partial [Tanacetum coccineum]
MKSYVDKRRKPLEFKEGDHVMLEVAPWKGVVRFGKKDKLAYRLRLPQELNNVHDTFHVSNLKKCLADLALQIPLEEIQVDAKLNFVEEPIEILEREFKKLKRSRIAIVKVEAVGPSGLCRSARRTSDWYWSGMSRLQGTGLSSGVVEQSTLDRGRKQIHMNFLYPESQVIGSVIEVALLFQAAGQMVKGLTEKLKTNPKKGIPEDESNILNTKNLFRSNTYPQKKGKSL